MAPLVMTLPDSPFCRSRLAALLDHFSAVEDPRDGRRILHPLSEILFLVVCGSTFAEDQSRLRKGHGARNGTTVRHFAINPGRSAADRHFIRSCRKIVGWDTSSIAHILRADRKG